MFLWSCLLHIFYCTFMCLNYAKFTINIYITVIFPQNLKFAVKLLFFASIINWEHGESKEIQTKIKLKELINFQHKTLIYHMFDYSLENMCTIHMYQVNWKKILTNKITILLYLMDRTKLKRSFKQTVI